MDTESIKNNIISTDSEMSWSIIVIRTKLKNSIIKLTRYVADKRDRANG